MRIFLAKFNWWHIGIILIFPIILALINPNWIFNAGVKDDYIYLGYQLDLSKYIGWFPSSEHYFIERMSWIAPLYYFYQMLPPIFANITTHLLLYYITTFSVYSTLNCLFDKRIALWCVILFGQFSVFLRSVGWDYVDGYGLALYSLSIVCIVYAVKTSPTRANLYFFFIGILIILMVVAQFFNSFYIPSLIIFYLILNYSYRQNKMIHAIAFTTLGGLFVFLILCGYYYILTDRWFILENTLLTSQRATSSNGWQDVINNRPETDKSLVSVLFLLTSLTALIVLKNSHRISKQSQQTIYHINAVISLFIVAFAVLAGWSVLGFHGYLRLSIYNTNILTGAFMVLAISSKQSIASLSDNKFNLLMAIILLLSFGWFLILSSQIIPNKSDIFMLLFFIVVFLYIITLLPIKLLSLLGVLHIIIIISFISDGGVRYVSIYLKDRYLHQSRFELTLQAVDIISPRYDNFSMENFRFWFNVNDPNWRIFEAIASIYLYGWGRIVDVPLSELSVSSVWDEKLIQTDEIILLTSEYDISTALSVANSYLYQFDYEAQLIETHTLKDWDTNIHIIFIHVIPRPTLTSNQLFYGFGDITDERLVISDFHNSETANNRTYRWTSEPIARMTFTLNEAIFDAEQSYQVQFWTLTPLEAEVLDSLTVTINGTQLDLERISQGADTLFQAQIDGQILVGDMLELTFETDRISRPADFGYADSRTLGVAFDWLTITPIED